MVAIYSFLFAPYGPVSSIYGIRIGKFTSPSERAKSGSCLELNPQLKENKKIKGHLACTSMATS
jgi:hypothetical protein